MRLTGLLILVLLLLAGCKDKHGSTVKSPSLCSDACKTSTKSGNIACTLTTPELQKRKATVIASLKSQLMEKKELKDGYAFKFPGDDKMIDELTEFIKSERECCSFFTFGLSISGDKSEVWLELTGPMGAKTFIDSELAI